MVSYDELAEMEMYDAIMYLGLGRVTTISINKDLKTCVNNLTVFFANIYMLNISTFVAQQGVL